MEWDDRRTGGRRLSVLALGDHVLVCRGYCPAFIQDSAPFAKDDTPFFDPDTLRSVVVVTLALTATVAALPFAGAYIAIPMFLLWYLKIYGKHSWVLTGALTICTPVFLFFFFEVTLKILLPKGWTEPWFFPLYARFF